jgi:CubicO group peptidase (beta-lactamase class C family)
MNAQLMVQSLADDLVAGSPAGSAAPAGVVLGLSLHGQRLTAASGFATLVDPRPMTVDAAFDLASVTKVVGTTAAIMRLVSDGALSLDTTVTSVLPGFAGNGDTTIRDLLQHQAGLWEWQPLYLAPNIGDGPVVALQGIPPRYPLRSGRHYSDLGFQYLGLAIEAVTGRALGDALQELVFAPLGMRSTSFGSAVGAGSGAGSLFAASSIGDRAERGMVATGEPFPVRWPSAGFPWREHELIGEANDGNCFHAFGGVAGHAGLFSTVDDLLTFAEALGDPDRETALCSPDVASAFFAPGPEPTQALGFRRMSIELRGAEHPLLWHPGFTGCAVGFVPGLGLGITLASNRLLTQGTPVATALLWERLVRVAGELYSSTSTDTRTP